MALEVRSSRNSSVLGHGVIFLTTSTIFLLLQEGCLALLRHFSVQRFCAREGGPKMGAFLKAMSIPAKPSEYLSHKNIKTMRKIM